MGSRASRKKKRAEQQRVQFDALEAENLRLKEELDRVKLRNAGAHAGAHLAQALEAVDDAGDTADEAVTMYASSMVIRHELQSLLRMLTRTIEEFDQRLERLDHRAEFPLKALNTVLSSDGPGLSEDSLVPLESAGGGDTKNREVNAASESGHAADAAEKNPADATAEADSAVDDEAEVQLEFEDVAASEVDGVAADVRDNTDLDEDDWIDEAAEAAAKGA